MLKVLKRVNVKKIVFENKVGWKEERSTRPASQLHSGQNSQNENIRAEISLPF